MRESQYNNLLKQYEEKTINSSNNNNTQPSSIENVNEFKTLQT
jgi:hypothetical protein